MLPSLSRALRIGALSAAFLAWTGAQHAVDAAPDDDEEDDGGDDDGGKGGDDGEDTDDTDDEEDPKEQPAVTSGGLFTLKTFPVREIFRPLTITQNITQAKLGLGADLSNKGAFESFGLNLEAVHGYRDNFMLLGAVTTAYNAAQFNVAAGFEGALAYDLIDFRLAARVGRAAANVSMDPEKVDYKGGDTKFSIDLGFPFRYAARPEIAIIALNTLMSIDLNSTDCADDGMGNEVCANEAKPDLNPSVGLITNPIEPVSVVVFATAQIVDFDFTNKLTVPATIRVQFSPSQKLDIGAEFTLLNVKPAEGSDKGPFDDRFLTLFAASRFGK
jgi:hypothetical protein